VSDPTLSDQSQADATASAGEEHDASTAGAGVTSDAGEPTEAAEADGTTEVSEDTAGAPSPQDLVRRLELEGEVAADYLEGLLDIADLDGDIDMDVEGQRAAVSIVGADLTHLVGRDGQVLEALQDLTRLAVQARTGERSRLMLDISGYRARRREQLTDLARQAVEEARQGSPVRMKPMTPFERKVVHDAVAAAGLTSESEGVEPERRVVVLPPA
jgi:spoIIIJ-associated protein